MSLHTCFWKQRRAGSEGNVPPPALGSRRGRGGSLPRSSLLETGRPCLAVPAAVPPAPRGHRWREGPQPHLHRGPAGVQGCPQRGKDGVGGHAAFLLLRARRARPALGPRGSADRAQWGRPQRPGGRCCGVGGGTGRVRGGTCRVKAPNPSARTRLAPGPAEGGPEGGQEPRLRRPGTAAVGAGPQLPADPGTGRLRRAWPGRVRDRQGLRGADLGVPPRAGRGPGG